MSNNMCSMCGGSASSPNYAKLVDSPIQQYGTILGEGPPENNFRRSHGGQMPSIQLCLPTLAGKPPPSTGHHAPGQQPSIIQVPCDVAKPCPQFVCEPCPPPPPTKVWLIKSSPAPQKCACLPIGNSSNQGCTPAKLMVCLPCPPPIFAGKSSPTKKQGCSIPFAVPQKIEGEGPNKKGAKYLPPPERKICSPNCIHVSDIKDERACTWHQNIPCPAHCFNTPL